MLIFNHRLITFTPISNIPEGNKHWPAKTFMEPCYFPPSTLFTADEYKSDLSIRCNLSWPRTMNELFALLPPKTNDLPKKKKTGQARWMAKAGCEETSPTTQRQLTPRPTIIITLQLFQLGYNSQLQDSKTFHLSNDTNVHIHTILKCHSWKSQSP